MSLAKEQNIDEIISRFINNSNAKTSDTDISQLIEIKKLVLEEQRNSREHELKFQEIELKKEENRLKDRQSKFPNSILSNPATTAVIAALAGFVTSSLVALIQGNSNLQLEKLKFQSNLIAKATESPDKAKRLDLLRFNIDAGLITDPYIISKLESLISKGEIPQSTSSGSYKLSCRNIYIQGDTLYASCATVSGQFKQTSLKGFKDCQGIENVNGSLRCENDGR